MLEYQLKDTDVIRQEPMCQHVLRRFLTLVSAVEQRHDHLLQGRVLCTEASADRLSKELTALGFRHALLQPDKAG